MNTSAPAPRHKWRRPLMVGVPVLAGLIIAGLYLSGGRYVSTEDAYVQVARMSVSSDVSGRVADVAVEDNQRVKANQVLFRIDDRPFRIAVEDAKAQLAAARLKVEAQKAVYRQREADLMAAKDALDYRMREYDRQRSLAASGIVAQSKYDQTAHEWQLARQQVAAAAQMMASALAELGGDVNIAADDHPLVQQAQAALDRAELNLSYTTVTAPEDGIVTKVEQLQNGDYVNAAQPLFSLLSERRIWVEANFKETDLTHMHPGQSAAIAIDAYPDHELVGHVASLSPGTGSAFSLLPAENATGNWVKVVQRLPVRLELDNLPDGMRLQAGMSVTVEVDTQHQRKFLAGFGAAFAAQDGKEKRQ